MSDPEPTPNTAARTPAKRRLEMAAAPIRQLRGFIAPTGLKPTEHNARYLEIEVFWAGLLSVAAAFNSAYALRLGATNAQIGFLSSIPALLALLITIPAGQILNRRARRMPWVVWSLALTRVGYLLVAIIPWLGLNQQGAAVVWTIILFTAPAAVFGVGWNSMMADVVPEVQRARLFAARNIILAVVVTSGTFIASRWLAAAPFPINYQLVYLIGFVGSMISTFYITRMRVPDSVVQPSITRSVSPRSAWRGQGMHSASSPTSRASWAARWPTAWVYG